MTGHVAELVLIVEASEDFVFSGYRHRNFRILPFSSDVMTIKLVALRSGRRSLPRFRVFKKSDVPDLTALDAISSAPSFPITVSKSWTHNTKNSEIKVLVI